MMPHDRGGREDLREMAEERPSREPPIRILVVSYLFPPAGGSGVVRSTKLARHLGAHGVTADFLVSRDPAPWLDPGRAEEVPGKVLVRRCPGLLPAQWRRPAASPRPREEGPRRRPAWRDRARAWLSIPDRAIYWAPFAVREGLRLAARRRYDAIYGVGGPWTNLLVARRLAARLGAPLVVDFKETWGAGPPLGFPNAFRRNLERGWERRVVRESARVICASGAIRDDLEARVPELRGASVEVVPNGFEPADYAGAPAPRTAGALRVVHTGYLSRAFSLAPVLDGVAAAVARGVEVELRLVGEHDDDVLGPARARGLGSRVAVVGPVGYREAVAEQLAADALLVLSSRSPLPGGAMPSKVYEYLGARRPLLAVAPADSQMARFLRSLGLPGAVRDADGIADRLLALSRGEAAAPDESAVRSFRWDVLVGRIAAIVRGAASGTTRGR